MFTIVASLRAKHQVEHQKALSEGLSVHGVPSVFSNSVANIQTKYTACWSWHNGRPLRNSGHEVLVMERSYIGDRFFYTSLGWNGLNGYADFPEYKPDNGKRFRSHGGVLKPWKTDGEYALILGQVPKDASLQGKDMVPWYQAQAAEIKEKYNIPVYFRPHPDLKKRGIQQRIEGTLQSEGSLEEALSGAMFTVCYNSNSSVDSILAGVPCIVGDKGTMAYDMCGKSIEEIIRPDREEWAYKLAFKQWSLEEIASGKALKGIVCRLS